jgi:hypothetical protein
MQTTCSVPLRLHSDKTHELFDWQSTQNSGSKIQNKVLVFTVAYSACRNQLSASAPKICYWGSVPLHGIKFMRREKIDVR